MSKKSFRKMMGKLGFNRHHWINRCNGGKTNKRNISWLKIKKHRAWHFLFNNLSLTDVVNLLRSDNNRKFKARHWTLVFKNLSNLEAAELLERLDRRKKSGSQ